MESEPAPMNNLEYLLLQSEKSDSHPRVTPYPENFI